MKVFISWSGEGAFSAAEALRSWLPSVIQSIDPFLSSTDIKVGKRSMSNLADALYGAGAAVVCVTRNNIDAPWINYEVGAISAKLDAPVCTLLLGISSRDVSGPLSQFQHASTGKEDIKRLLFSLNDALVANNERPVPADALKASFEALWPKLKEELDRAVASSRVVDLRGIWEIDFDGGLYYINQVGEDIWWLGEQSNENPQWCNVAWGRIYGQEIRLKWCDVPKGQINSDGTLVLTVVDENTLKKHATSGGYGASLWKRRTPIHGRPCNSPPTRMNTGVVG